MAKKAKTVKDLDKDVKELLILVENLKKELNETKVDLNSKIKELQNKLNAKINEKSTPPTTFIRKNKNKCNKCDYTGRTDVEIKNHMNEVHQRQFKCTKCYSSFLKRSDLEEHISDHHEISESLKCTECDRTFILKWRFRKHMNVHNSNAKYCHYYNNKKVCMFEKLGCKFKHETSPQCKFGENCNVNLCQYTHQKNDISKNNSVNSSIESYSEDEDEEVEDFAIDLFCYKYCSKDNFYHIHCKEHVDNYYGLNLKTTIVRFDRDRRKVITNIFPCELCDNVSADLKEHQKHISNAHTVIEPKFKCIFCEVVSKIPEDLTDHMVTIHKEDIKKQILDKKTKVSL